MFMSVNNFISILIMVTIHNNCNYGDDHSNIYFDSNYGDTPIEVTPFSHFLCIEHL